MIAPEGKRRPLRSAALPLRSSMIGQPGSTAGTRPD